MSRGERPAGPGLLRLYPRPWRARYEAEVLGVLEEMDLGWRIRFDLARGALDAHLHTPSLLPAIAALIAGGLWAFAGAGVVAQPAPPDWPGYLIETLPLAIVAVASGTVAIVACWARRSDRAGRPGTVAVWLALAGHLVWVVALAAALLGFSYGSVTAAAQAAGAIGCLLVGLVLFRANDLWIGGLLLVAPPFMLFGWPVAWLGFGLAWTMVGFLLLTEPGSGEGSTLTPSA